jgi:hypothetical protein
MIPEREQMKIDLLNKTQVVMTKRLAKPKFITAKYIKENSFTEAR